MAKKTYNLTIYLIKDSLNSEDEIIASPLLSKDIEDVGKLFYKNSRSNPPKWLSLFEGNGLRDLYTSSAAAVLLLDVNERKFAVTFGAGGRHLLQKGVTEERFGLITTLNSVKEESIRSIDTKTLESEGIQTRTQSARPTVADDFGVDVDRDLVRSVTGEPIDDSFGKLLSGKDSLHATLKLDVDDIKDYLSSFLSQYAKEDYIKKFPWIDALKEINDPARIEELNASLVEEINKESSNKVWLTVPEILDWTDHGGFKYSARKGDETLNDIGVPSFKVAIGKDTVEISDLTSNGIYRFSETNEYQQDHWRVYECIYFECSTKDETFFLTSGKWYSVKASLVKTVSDYHATIPEDTHGLTFIDYDHKNEAEYNEALAGANDAACIDADSIQIEGRSKFEFCDVYTKDRKLIHIKRYSGSAVLSHLFNQGYVSGNFLLDEEFRGKINEKLPVGFKIGDVTQRPNVPGGDKYTVIFGVISRTSKETLDLPFFSKLTLMHVTKSLINFGFDVSLVKIKNLKNDKEEDAED